MRALTSPSSQPLGLLIALPSIGLLGVLALVLSPSAPQTLSPQAVGGLKRQMLLGTESEIDRALGPDSNREHRQSHIGRVQARGVSEGYQDPGLPTLTSNSIWEHGSPQNYGWNQGKFETGTGRIKDTQYSWWQRHLMPQKDFDQTMAHLQSSEPHYDAHGNEQDPDYTAGGVTSFRNPGFTRMTP